ncbi:MAG: leucine-rich repeat domain-containing protein [Clostridiales bacterium]|nr:leucine-rich repeat domain-containing protein [Clostridiales bacterium]
MEKGKKKINSLIISLLILVIALTTFNITLAWFTDSDNSSDTIKFGTINVKLETTNLVVTESVSGTTSEFMPGDEFKISYSLKNLGEAVYYLVKVNLFSTGEVPSLEAIEGVYFFDLQNGITKLDTETDTITAGTIAKNSTVSFEHVVGGDVTKDFENDLMGREVAVNVTVLAIQQANLEMEDARSKLDELLNPADASTITVNNIEYTYSITNGGYGVTAGTFNVAGGGANATGDVVIPYSINGVPVTYLGDNSFFNNINITSVIIPCSVKDLNSAFYGCENLTSVNIPGSVKEVEVYAFRDVSGLTNVILNEGIETISSICFNGNPNLTTIVIPKSMKVIAGANFGSVSHVYYRGSEEEWDKITITSPGVFAEGYTVTYNYVEE